MIDEAEDTDVVEADEAQPNGADTDGEPSFQTVRDTIRASIEELEGDGAEVSDQEAVGEADSAAEISEEKKPPQSQDKAISESDDESEETESGKPGSDPEVILPPASWNADDRKGWDDLPRAAQETITRREAERDKYLHEQTSRIGPIRSVIDDNEQYFQQRGVSPEESFRLLIKAERALWSGTAESKLQALREIARDYGIPFPEASQERQEEDPYADPDIDRRLKPVTERLDRIEGSLTSRQRADDTAQQNAANDVSKRFFDELEAMDPKEAPEIRYIDQVLPQFEAMVNAEIRRGATLDVAALKTVFRNAARATPAVYEAMQADMASRAAAETKAKQEAEAKATKTVKKVSSSVSGGAGAVSHSKIPQKESVRETINRSIAELESRPGAIR